MIKRKRVSYTKHEHKILVYSYLYPIERMNTLLPVQISQKTLAGENQIPMLSFILVFYIPFQHPITKIKSSIWCFLSWRCLTFFVSQYYVLMLFLCFCLALLIHSSFHPSFVPWMETESRSWSWMLPSKSLVVWDWWSRFSAMWITLSGERVVGNIFPHV